MEGSGWGVGLKGQGGCERRIEVFVKIKKYIYWDRRDPGVGLGDRVWGIRVDMNDELNF